MLISAAEADERAGMYRQFAECIYKVFFGFDLSDPRFLPSCFDCVTYVRDEPVVKVICFKKRPIVKRAFNYLIIFFIILCGFSYHRLIKGIDKIRLAVIYIEVDEVHIYALLF